MAARNRSGHKYLGIVIFGEWNLVSDNGATFRELAGPGGAVPMGLCAAPADLGVLALTPAGLFALKDPEAAWTPRLLPAACGRPLAAGVDGEGWLWVRSAEGCFRQAPGGPWERLPGPLAGGVPDNLKFTPDREGWLWINAVEGIFRCRGRRVQAVDAVPRGQVPITALVDQEGSTWLAAVGVVQVLGRGAWSIEGRPEGLPSDVVWTTARDASGRLWAATDGGLAVKADGAWRTVRKGQFSRVRLHPDGSMVAVGSPGGTLYRVDPRTLQVEAVRADCLPPTPVSRGLGVDRDGGVYLSDFHGGAARGVRRGTLDLGARAGRRPQPRRQFRGGPGLAGGGLPAHPVRGLAARGRRLGQPGRDPSLQPPRRHPVRRRRRVGRVPRPGRPHPAPPGGGDLEAHRFRVPYPSLSHGSYRLEVRLLRDGTPGPALSLAVRVLPHPWETWWARLLALAGAGLGVYGLIVLRYRALRRHNAELQDMVAARTVELQSANLELARASRAKSMFLASMSHELRTPLNAILLYSELLGDDARERGDGEASRDLTRIQASGRHLLSMINSVLDLAKIEAGMMACSFEEVAIGPLLNEVADTLGPLAGVRGNQVRLSLAGEFSFRTDLTKVRQVLINLGGNACKFTEGGSVTLEAAREGADLVLQVADTGKGMCPQEVQRVFEAFEQGSEEIARTHGGTGLGLTISRHLVRLLGGTIQVESEPGVGSRFRVRIPEAVNPAG